MTDTYKEIWEEFKETLYDWIGERSTKKVEIIKFEIMFDTLQMIAQVEGKHLRNKEMKELQEKYLRWVNKNDEAERVIRLRKGRDMKGKIGKTTRVVVINNGEITMDRELTGNETKVVVQGEINKWERWYKMIKEYIDTYCKNLQKDKEVSIERLDRGYAFDIEDLLKSTHELDILEHLQLKIAEFEGGEHER